MSPVPRSPQRSYPPSAPPHLWGEFHYKKTLTPRRRWLPIGSREAVLSSPFSRDRDASQYFGVWRNGPNCAIHHRYSVVRLFVAPLCALSRACTTVHSSLQSALLLLVLLLQLCRSADALHLSPQTDVAAIALLLCLVLFRTQLDVRGKRHMGKAYICWRARWRLKFSSLLI